MGGNSTDSRVLGHYCFCATVGGRPLGGVRRPLLPPTPECRLSLAPVRSSSSSSRTTSLRRRCRCLVSMTNCSALVLCLHHCMVPAHFCSFAQLSHCCISLPFVPLLVDLCASLFVPPNRGPKYICLRFGLPWQFCCFATVPP